MNRGGNDKLKRIGVFIFYDNRGYVDPYKAFLLEKMSELLYELHIVINGFVLKEGMDILRKYSNKILIRDNEGYDAAGYSTWINNNKDILRENDIDELVMFNDTFYGPFFSLGSVFEDMRESEYDFWGLIINPGGFDRSFDDIINEHIQSFFLCVKKRMLQSDDFLEFWDTMIQPKTKIEAIYNFEIRFTQFFSERGYHYGSWLGRSASERVLLDNYGRIMPYEIIKKYHFPVVKTKLMAVVHYPLCALIENYIEENKLYDFNLIEQKKSRRRAEGTEYVFDEARIINFCERCDEIYIFGNGVYGESIMGFLIDNKVEVKGYITSVLQPNAFEIKTLEICKNDGIIVAVSKKNIPDVLKLIDSKEVSCNILLPNY